MSFEFDTDEVAEVSVVDAGKWDPAKGTPKKPASGPVVAHVPQSQAKATSTENSGLNPTTDSDDGPCPFLMDPRTGAIIAEDPDSLIEAFIELKRLGDAIYATQIGIRTRLAAMTEGQSEAKTRRVQGRRHKAKIEMPSPGWDQSILKEAWNYASQVDAKRREDDPNAESLRDQVLKIDTIGVKAREWKKLAETAGTPEVEMFRDMVKGAVKPPSGTPTVSVEQ